MSGIVAGLNMGAGWLTRAGRYVEQPGGYRAFIPNSLPPQPPLQYDDELLDILSKADRSLGRLDGTTGILPNPDLFVLMYVRKEAVLSSQIEGTQASLLDILEFEIGQAHEIDPIQVAEVINYVDAMNYGLNRLRDLPVSMRLIREIHQRLMAGVRGGERSPGEFRRTQNWIGATGAPLANAVFVPPPAAELGPLLSDLERFLHDQTPMPALIKVGLAHAQFETIHPFLDGNGRTGRLLITFLLCDKQILGQPLLYLSHYFKRARTEYYDRLQAVRERGEWEGWVKFFLRGVFDVAQEATHIARDIVEMRERDREHVTARLARRSHNGLRLLEGLYFQPVISVKAAARITDLSFGMANTLVNQFVELGILQETTGHKRNRRFSYERYLNLFTDPDTEAPRLART
jgi:Fic family protein